MIDSLLQKFSDNGIMCKKKWLEDCINTENHKTFDSILQYLINLDISESCESLPNNFVSSLKQEKFVITEKVFLQINEVVDISLPLDKRQKAELSTKGTLKILLTDGNSEFIGISKKSITSFSPSTSPGSKIVLIPPVQVYFGVIFLSESKIKFMGGVSQTAIKRRKQAYSKELPREMSQPNALEQNNNNIDRPASLTVNNNTTLTANNNNNTSKRTFDFLSDSNDDDIEVENEISKIQKSINQDHKSDTDIDDIESINESEHAEDKFLSDDIESINESEHSEDKYISDVIESLSESDIDNCKISNKTKNNTVNKKESIQINHNSTSKLCRVDQKEISNTEKEKKNVFDITSSSDSYLLSDSDIQMNETVNQKDANTKNNKTDSFNRSNIFFLSDESIDDSDNMISSIPNRTEKQNLSKSSDIKFFTIKELNEKHISNKTILTNAKITKTSCFNIERNQSKATFKFSLNLTLCDSTGEMEVQVCPDYIEKILRKKPTEKCIENFRKDHISLSQYFKSLKPPLSLIQSDDRKHYLLIEYHS